MHSPLSSGEENFISQKGISPDPAFAYDYQGVQTLKECWRFPSSLGGKLN
jgi:hypothetical protein